MSHFGRSGPPDIKDTFSLLVLNISFRTSPDDLYPLFDKYGKVVDVFIPRDRRTGDSRGFAFVRYKYADEAQKAVDKLDGITVDGRDIMVQFAKYGPNAEPVKKGRVTEVFPRSRGRSRSRSPRPRYQDDHRGKDYRRRNYSPSHGRYERRIHRDSEREYRRRSRSRSMSPDYNRGRGKAVYDSDRNRYKSRSDESMSPRRRNSSPKRSRSPDSSPHRRSPHRRSRDGKSPRNDGRGKDMHDNVRKRYRSRSLESGSPAKHSPTPKRSQSPDSPNRRSAHRRSRDEHSPQSRNCDKSLYDNDRKRHKSRSCESASPVRRSPTPKRSISPDCPNKRSPNTRSRDHVRVPRSPLESASPPRCSTPRKKSLSPDGNSSPLHGRRSSRRSHSASPIDDGHSPRSSCKLLLGEPFPLIK